jgi:hypothetical protein
MKTDLDVSIRPLKWQKRGSQPAVALPQVSPLLALNKLAEQIRQEPDPKIKKRLEAQYAAESKPIEDFTTDRTSQKLSSVIGDIVTTFSPIVDPHPDAEAGIRMPETMTRDQWQEVHARLIQCKRAAAGWLTKSRRFATERWGADFVGKCEAQMELALGIEQQDHQEPQAPDYLAIITKIAKRAASLPMDEIDRWDRATCDSVLQELEPVAAILEKLRDHQA